MEYIVRKLQFNISIDSARHLELLVSVNNHDNEFTNYQ